MSSRDENESFFQDRFTAGFNIEDHLRSEISDLKKEIKRLNDYNKQFIKEIFDLEQRLVNKTRHIEELYETIAILKREL